jgi:hypothetical protein
VKTALLTFCIAWAMPAHADTSLPTPATGKSNSWADACAARIDAVARTLKLKPGAKVVVYPLKREDGKPNLVRYVEYVGEEFEQITVGDDASGQYPRSGSRDRWEASDDLDGSFWYRLHKNRFGKIHVNTYEEQFKLAVDECLKMGEGK